MSGSLFIPGPPAIEAIDRLTDLENLADEFEAARGYQPELISHWDPKPEFRRKLEGLVATESESDESPVDYVYSGYLQLGALLDRLGERTDRGALLTPSGTTSIVNAIAYLKNVGCKHLHIISPSYFAVEAGAGAFGISTSFSEVKRVDRAYELPPLPHLAEDSAVWLTFPIYGTSCYLNPRSVATFIDSLPNSVVVIVDEGLAFLDRPSLIHVESLDRVIRISTPSKPICINGEKFSVVTFPKHLTDSLDAWSECFSGGIGAAGMRSMRLFQSDHYETVVKSVRTMLSERRSKLSKLLATHATVSIDRETDGHFVTSYWPELSMELADDISFIKSLIDESGAVPMPSSRNRHPRHYGFAFRVNLLRLDDAGLGGFARLADSLDRRV